MKVRVRFCAPLCNKSDETRTTISPRVCIASLTETVVLQLQNEWGFFKTKWKDNLLVC